jgi:hypothetical protein
MFQDWVNSKNSGPGMLDVQMLANLTPDPIDSEWPGFLVGRKFPAESDAERSFLREKVKFLDTNERLIGKIDLSGR